MLTDTLILAVPVVLVLVGIALAKWDTRRWQAKCQAASRPPPVALFPQGAPRQYPPKDTRAGRAARRAKHGASQ